MWYSSREKSPSNWTEWSYEIILRKLFPADCS
jgi:hypothetical protein